MHHDRVEVANTFVPALAVPGQSRDRCEVRSRSRWLWREFDVDAMVSFDDFDERN